MLDCHPHSAVAGVGDILYQCGVLIQDVVLCCVVRGGVECSIRGPILMTL